MSTPFGNKIKVTRQVKGLSLRELSELTGVSDSQLSKIERGLCKPHNSSIQKINEILGLDIDEMLGLITQDDIPTIGKRKIPKQYIEGAERRYKLFIRDSFTCQLCGRKPPEVSIRPSLIIPNEEDMSLDNSITLCSECHDGREAFIKKEGIENDVLNNKLKNYSIWD